MNNREILSLSALQLGRRIKSGDIGVREAVQACLDRIDERGSDYNAFITVIGDKALLTADMIQRKIQSGELTSPLAGVPMAVKDNICTNGIPTTCASKMLKRFIPPYSATVIDRLNRSGAILLGKLNMDEFAMGCTGETSYYGAARNPHDPDRVCGGSSSGSACAVSAGMSHFSLGSDTGGSIRTPCSHCGLYGIKPTYGRVSRYGLIAYASSFDQIGPITRTTADLAAVLDEISGGDGMDSTCPAKPYDSLLASLSSGIRGLRIGIIDECLSCGVDPGVKDCILSTARVFESLGCKIDYVSIPEISYSLAAYYVIAFAQASSNLARYDGVRYGYRADNISDLAELYSKSRSKGFGSEVQRRILLGSFILSAGYYDKYYLKAQNAQNLIKAAFDRALSQYDLLLCPTAPTAAPLIGNAANDPMKMYLSDIFTVQANLTGLPALTAPCGFDGGMPVGLQLIGRRFEEETLLNASFAFEQYNSRSCGSEVTA